MVTSEEEIFITMNNYFMEITKHLALKPGFIKDSATDS